MNTAQKWVLLVATLVIFGVNAYLALPTFHKGTHHPVGPELVNVYAPSPGSSTPTVPIVQSGTHANTGERVSVYLPWAYREDEVLLAPRLTLLLLLGFGICFGVASFTGRKAPGRDNDPTQTLNPAP